MTDWSFPRHIHYERQLRRIAAAWFASKGYLVSPRYKYILASYYQFFHEVLFALELGGVFVLLCDQRSPAFAYQDGNVQRGLMTFLLSVTPEHLHEKVKVVYIQDVVNAIRDTNNHGWIEEFELKYGLRGAW